MTFLRAVAFGVALTVAAAVAGTPGRAELAERRRALRLELIRERARVMRDNPEAVAIGRRIEKLYRELDAVVEADPGVRRLTDELARVEAALAPPAEDRLPDSGDAEGRQP